MYNSTIITINKDGVVQTVDKNCCKLFGYDLEELIGGPVKKIIPAPYKEQHDNYMQNYLRTGVHKSRPVEGQHKDGTIFPIRLSVSKVGEGDNVIFIGNSIFFGGCNSLGMIDKLEDKSVSITINQVGQVVSCNQNVEEIFGYKPNEVIGHNVNMLMPNPHAERHDGYLRNYINGGEAKVIGKVRNVAAKHKNGTVFPVSLQVEQLKIGAINLFRGKVEKVETVEAVFTIDSIGTIVSCNLNFVQSLCGYSNHDLMGKNIGILFPAIHQPSGTELSGSEKSATESEEEEEGSPLKKQKLSHEPDESVIPESWKTPGVHRKLLRHKDGSLFPIDLEIGSFQDDNGTWLFSGRIKRSAEISKNSDLDSTKAIGKYIIVKTVGQGSYGKVKLAYNKDTKEQYAIKILQKSGMKPLELERARRETEILKQLIHPHIARLYEVIEAPTSLNLVMEYAESTLLSYVLERNGLGEQEAKEFFRQIISAVKYCHDLSIIHRDIKHQNLLLDNHHNVKLIDFGLSNFMEEGKLRSTFCGTPAYAAPEMILGKKYVGPEVDIWSLGVVLYSMITGVFPFENVADIIKGQYIDPITAGPECCNLIRQMLNTDITARITVDKIIAHTWFAENEKEIPTTCFSVSRSKLDVKEIEVSVVTTAPQLPENGTRGH